MRNVAMNVRNYLMRKEAEVLTTIYAPELRKKGSASTIIGEVILVVVLLALSVAYKQGGLTFLTDLWTFVTTNAKSIWN